MPSPGTATASRRRAQGPRSTPSCRASGPRRARSGMPKIWGPTHRQSLHRIAPDAVLPLELRAKFSKRMAFTLTIRRPDGRVVATRRHTNGHIRWTWGGHAPVLPGGTYRWVISAAGARGFEGTLGVLPLWGLRAPPDAFSVSQGSVTGGGLASLEHPDGSTLDIASAGGSPQTELVTDFDLDTTRPVALAATRAGASVATTAGGPVDVALWDFGSSSWVDIGSCTSTPGRACKVESAGRRPRVRKLGRRLVVGQDARSLHVRRRRRRRLGARAPQGLTSTATTSSAVCATPATTSRPASSTPVAERPSSPPARLHPAAAQVVALEAREAVALERPVASLDRLEDVRQEGGPVDRRPFRSRSDVGETRASAGRSPGLVVRVHADADDHLAVSHLGQDAGQLATVDDDVVRPAHERLRPRRGRTRPRRRRASAAAAAPAASAGEARARRAGRLPAGSSTPGRAGPGRRSAPRRPPRRPRAGRARAPEWTGTSRARRRAGRTRPAGGAARPRDAACPPPCH